MSVYGPSPRRTRVELETLDAALAQIAEEIEPATVPAAQQEQAPALEVRTRAGGTAVAVVGRGNLGRRLGALEGRLAPAPEDLPDWPLDDQFAAVADALDFYARFHPNEPLRYSATHRELHPLGLLCAMLGLGEDGGECAFPSGLRVRLVRAGERFEADVPRRIRAEDLPDWALEHFERMEPAGQPKRDAWLSENRGVPFEPWRERVRRHEERVRAFEEETKQRDRELLERNRASVGLPPLAPGQIAEWGLEGTARGEGHS